MVSTFSTGSYPGLTRSSLTNSRLSAVPYGSAEGLQTGHQQISAQRWYTGSGNSGLRLLTLTRHHVAIPPILMHTSDFTWLVVSDLPPFFGIGTT